MREELNRGLIINGVVVQSAVQRVEDEVAKWACHSYTHITRAVSVSGTEEESQSIHLETIFSKPTQDRPVPVAVVYVFFELDTATSDLTYHFEQESVRHQVGGSCLSAGKYESWLDRLIGDKLQVRRLHDLATPFEETRLVAPPVVSSDPQALPELQAEDSESEDFAGQKSEQAIKVEQESADQPLSILLANIFDAADEESEFELTHKEVADLLYATPLGLADWDVKLLLTTATELETGRIQYKPFVESAPEIIEALLQRRAKFEQRKVEMTQVTVEAIDLCHGEEIEEVARSAREAFASQDSTSKGSLSRHEFRMCLASRSERFSNQEVQMLMQMCTEDDFLQVPYDDFTALLQQLRIDSLHNALVETDVGGLRMHLLLFIRRAGLTADKVMPVWTLRDVLLHADQLCLSRMQIHAIMCIVHPNEHGDVDVDYFLRVCCTVIPSMFDTAAFMETAATIKRDKEDAQAKQELEELQGISSSLAMKKRADEDEEEDAHANAPDRDAVEKALIHVGNLFDDKIRAQPTLDVYKFLEAMHHESVQQCQLSEPELRGFIAEACIDDRGEIAYADHVKTWVPIIFEMRRSRLYDQVLNADWGLDAPNLVDLSQHEAQFPTYVDDGGKSSRPGSARRRPSSSRNSLRRKDSKGGSRRPSSRSRERGNSTLLDDPLNASPPQSPTGGARRGRRRDGDSDGGNSRASSRCSSRASGLRSRSGSRANLF